KFAYRNFSMALPQHNPTTLAAWNDLQAHYDRLKNVRMKQMFAENPERVEKFHIRWDDFLVDYSKNIIDVPALESLYDLARQAGLQEAVNAFFSGEAINQTENRAVMHTALRNPRDSKAMIDGVDVMADVVAVRQKMHAFCDSVIDGNRRGYTGKKFTDVVNIGIGGSDLGPAMAVDALQYYRNELNVHFVS